MKRPLLVGCLLALSVALVAAWVADRHAAGVIEARIGEQLRRETALLARWVAEDGRHADTAQALAERAATDLLARVTLIDADGRVIGDSAVDDPLTEIPDSHLDRPEVAAAALAGVGQSVRRSATTHLRYLYSARLVPDNSEIRFVRLALRADGAPNFERPGFLALFVLSLLVSSSGLGFGLLVLRAYRRRTATLVARLQRGETPVEPDSGWPVELRELAARVRDTSFEWSRKHDEQAAALRVLRLSVAALREGVLVVDGEPRVVLANAAARDLLEFAGDPEGLPLSQVARHPALLERLTGAARDGSAPGPLTLTREDTRRSIELRVRPLDDGAGRVGGGAIALLLDVSRVEALERVRRDFVANVSHELRTPLTAIKAAVETLLDDPDAPQAQRRQFTTMIRRNAEAMEGLLERLTDLSLLETGSARLERQPFDLAELARDVAEQLRPMAGSTELRLDLAQPLHVDGDPMRLRQVLVNLIENALKFNRDRQPIDISGRCGDEHVLLSIRDRGVGVPVHQRDRIFHRFYQVADDRSRRRPGSGLGLAIVKHLVRLHGGTIEVDSEVGVGSTFTLRLPRDRGESV